MSNNPKTKIDYPNFTAFPFKLQNSLLASRAYELDFIVNQHIDDMNRMEFGEKSIFSLVEVDELILSIGTANDIYTHLLDILDTFKSKGIIRQEFDELLTIIFSSDMVELPIDQSGESEDDTQNSEVPTEEAYHRIVYDSDEFQQTLSNSYTDTDDNFASSEDTQELPSIDPSEG